MGGPSKRHRTHPHRARNGDHGAAACEDGGPPMNHDAPFRLMPQQVSEGAARIDHIYLAGVALCAIILLVVAGLVLSFCIRYRAGSATVRPGDGPKPAWVELSL